MSLNGGRVAGHRRMVVTLDTHRLQTLEQVREFLDGSQPIDLQVQTRAEAYAFVDQTVRRFDYILQGKTEKGVLRRFLAKVTGLSRAQLTRLLTQHRTTGAVADRRGAPRRPFPRRYTSTDIGLLAEVARSTARCPGQPHASSVPAPTLCSTTAGSNAWPASPTATCTTCGTRRPISGDAGRHRSRRARCRWRSANGAGRNRSDSPVTCESIRFIRATAMASRACTT